MYSSQLAGPVRPKGTGPGRSSGEAGDLPVKLHSHFNDTRGVFSWLLHRLWGPGQELGPPGIQLSCGLLVEGTKAKGLTMEGQAEQSKPLSRASIQGTTARAQGPNTEKYPPTYTKTSPGPGHQKVLLTRPRDQPVLVDGE